MTDFSRGLSKCRLCHALPLPLKTWGFSHGSRQQREETASTIPFYDSSVFACLLSYYGALSLETRLVRLALATSKSRKDAATAVLVLIGTTYKQTHET